MVAFSSSSKTLLNSIEKAFSVLDIKVSKSKKGVYLYGSTKVKLFFKLVGSSNPKHIYKFKEFIIKNKVPKTDTIEYNLKRFKKRTAIPYLYNGPVV